MGMYYVRLISEVFRTVVCVHVGVHEHALHVQTVWPRCCASLVCVVHWHAGEFALTQCYMLRMQGILSLCNKVQLMTAESWRVGVHVLHADGCQAAMLQLAKSLCTPKEIQDTSKSTFESKVRLVKFE
jgi:hypothetical protein